MAQIITIPFFIIFAYHLGRAPYPILTKKLKEPLKAFF